MEGRNLYEVASPDGDAARRRAPVDADLVMPVPDTGAPAAAGFAEASGLPYREGMYRNRYAGRTFIQPSAGLRHRGVTIKLNPLREVVNGKRLIVVDDSIVRGTTTKRIVELLRKAGATEVHVRISAPPIYHPCFYGIDTPDRDRADRRRPTPNPRSASSSAPIRSATCRSAACWPRSTCRTSGSASPASTATTRNPVPYDAASRKFMLEEPVAGLAAMTGARATRAASLPGGRRRRRGRRAGRRPDARPRRVDPAARGRRRAGRVRWRDRASRPATASRCSSPRPTASARRRPSPRRSAGSTRSASTSSRCAPTTSSAAAPSRSPSSTTSRSASVVPEWRRRARRVGGGRLPRRGLRAGRWRDGRASGAHGRRCVRPVGLLHRRRRARRRHRRLGGPRR